jgi:FAD/FMN-containing dehydrogenase
VGSDYGKKLRWRAEQELGEFASGKLFSRNELLNEGVEIYENREENSTDILHEYFIPASKVADFIADLQKIIPAHRADLLNITIRNVYKDEDTYMRYANEEVFGFVMFFNQGKDSISEARMQKLTSDLIDASLKLGGTYYLPYRLHASREQFYKAYPQAESFFRLKKKYDPKKIFQNEFYLKYK